MDANFWHERWKRNETAFHEGHPNPLLVTYFGALSLAAGSRIFVPLCGKSLDISWLLSQGYRIAGAELSKIAIEQLFVELGVEPFISALGDIDLWSANNLDIFVGDLFAVSRNMLGPVDAIYDRAALVALPEQVRNRYATHLRDITEEAPQLLICYEYDQRVMDGPPFSIDAEEVHRHYASRYDLSLIASRPVAGGLKGKCAAQENLWLLRNESSNHAL
jgi:thiopurine S-methyltransferase